MNELNLFISAFVTLFIIVDPIGTAAVFAVLSKGLNAGQARRLAVKAVLIAAGLYAFFGYFGPMLMLHMGISFTAFKITGGLLLFVTAFRMIMGRHDEGDIDNANSVYPDRSHLAIFPLAIPLLAGPGCLTAFLLLLNKGAEGHGSYVVILALILVLCSALLAFLISSHLKQLLGQGLMIMIARVMGILLATMAVQLVINGIREVVMTFQLPGV